MKGYFLVLMEVAQVASSLYFGDKLKALRKSDIYMLKMISAGLRDSISLTLSTVNYVQTSNLALQNYKGEKYWMKLDCYSQEIHTSSVYHFFSFLLNGLTPNIHLITSLQSSFLSHISSQVLC